MAKKTNFRENMEGLARKKSKNKLLLKKERKAQHIFIHNHVDDWRQFAVFLTQHHNNLSPQGRLAGHRSLPAWVAISWGDNRPSLYFALLCILLVLCIYLYPPLKLLHEQLSPRWPWLTPGNMLIFEQFRLSQGALVYIPREFRWKPSSSCWPQLTVGFFIFD